MGRRGHGEEGGAGGKGRRGEEQAGRGGGESPGRGGKPLYPGWSRRLGTPTPCQEVCSQQPWRQHPLQRQQDHYPMTTTRPFHQVLLWEQDREREHHTTALGHRAGVHLSGACHCPCLSQGLGTTVPPNTPTAPASLPPRPSSDPPDTAGQDRAHSAHPLQPWAAPSQELSPPVTRPSTDDTHLHWSPPPSTSVLSPTCPPL